jgi:CDGSH-type Zn-finger protein
MAEPEIAQKFPYAIELNPGTYWWCACGKSSNQPFCDGSHKGSEFSPEELVLTETTKVWLCGCKHTGNAPHCDGSHKQL